jgi:hypothetical protein
MLIRLHPREAYAFGVVLTSKAKAAGAPPADPAESEGGECPSWRSHHRRPVAASVFTLRLSCSGKAVHAVFASQGQEAFLEGHVRPFETVGGTPYSQTRSDLRSAVHRVLLAVTGSSRSGGLSTAPLPFHLLLSHLGQALRAGPRDRHQLPGWKAENHPAPPRATTAATGAGSSAVSDSHERSAVPSDTAAGRRRT